MFGFQICYIYRSNNLAVLLTKLFDNQFENLIDKNNILNYNE